MTVTNIRITNNTEKTNQSLFLRKPEIEIGRPMIDKKIDLQDALYNERINSIPFPPR